MHFRLIDRIVELKPGSSITAIKHLRPDEGYLADHFPRFPVMPGVLMLEVLFQASMWLVRRSEDFSYAAVTLQEARNVKFSDFVQPGQNLVVTAEIIKKQGSLITLKAQGTLENSTAVNGRLILEQFNLADRYPEKAPLDPYVRRRMLEFFNVLLASSAG
jgi:3-hydroxyacyl-[acyl-carrier-protein] dehydratase